MWSFSEVYSSTMFKSLLEHVVLVLKRTWFWKKPVFWKKLGVDNTTFRSRYMYALMIFCSEPTLLKRDLTKRYRKPRLTITLRYWETHKLPKSFSFYMFANDLAVMSLIITVEEIFFYCGDTITCSRIGYETLHGGSII